MKVMPDQMLEACLRSKDTSNLPDDDPWIGLKILGVLTILMGLFLVYAIATEQPAKDPILWRRNDEGAYGDRVRIGSDKVEFYLMGGDYDVTYDDKTWYHLFGKECLKKCPRMEVKRPAR